VAPFTGPRYERHWERSEPYFLESASVSGDVLASAAVHLMSLEFGAMQYGQDHPGKAVSRYDLMKACPLHQPFVDTVFAHRSARGRL